MVRALASHQCGPGSNPWVDAICAVGSLPCSERFFSGYSGFPSPQKPTLPNSNSIWNARTCLNEFIRSPNCFVGEQIRIAIQASNGTAAYYFSLIVRGINSTVTSSSAFAACYLALKSALYAYCS